MGLHDAHLPADARLEAALARDRVAAQGRDVRVGGGVATVRQYLRAGLVEELHLAQSPALGFEVTERVASPNAMHVVLTKQGARHD